MSATKGGSLVASLVLLGWLGVPGATAEEPVPPGEPTLLVGDGATLELPALDPGIPSPAAHLGRPLGSGFTHHAAVVAYLEHLAATSERTALWRYGETYEGRPLILVAVSSPANIGRLEEIRRRHLRLADPRRLSPAEEQELAASLPAVVWLAYGIHGNESSSTEAALLAAYVLAAGGGSLAETLEGTVVLIDPVSNPDGRERYVHFFEAERGSEPDPLAASAEHWEPWPGGRQNHYLIDLNRDWAWATQRETRSRLEAFRDWEPQVYVDFHEMDPDSTYFFPPPTEPVHPQIDRRLLGWLEVFGRANAAALDRQGWLYYAGEVFDLFYPGYGDSYPALRGAVGMTYEMAGGARAGQTLRRSDGSLLTLADRIAHHFATSMATISTAAANRRALLADFAADRRRAAEAPARTYLWPSEQPEAAAAAELLAFHGIEVGELPAEIELAVRPVVGGEAVRRRFRRGTYAASSAQPLGNLLRSLMDLEASMPEKFLTEQRRRLETERRPEFYDITAWSLPLAYNLDAWVLDGTPPATGQHRDRPGELQGEGQIGYLVPPQGLAGYRLAAALLRRKLQLRVALEGLRLGGREHPAGTLFVPTRGNAAETGDLLAELAREIGVEILGASTSRTEAGISLGSEAMLRLRPPRIGLLSGPGISPTSFGFLWHLFDRDLGLPHHRLALRTLDRIDLSELDVLVLPDAHHLEQEIDEATAEALDAWVKAGGTLVAIGGAVSWLREREMTAVREWEPPEEEVAASGSPTLARRQLATPGAALSTLHQAHHPLAIGLPSPPPVLYEGSRVLLATGSPSRDVLVADEGAPLLAGFAWPEAQERLAGSLLVGTEARGRGRLVLFSQEPVYRLFWRGTAPLLLNAVLYGPSLPPAPP